jgi:subtilisin family serine protease
VLTRVHARSKIIGARAYRQGHTGLSPVDTVGHGSHTASTVAGRVVEGVGLAGLAVGSARGAVPGARLAVYKACWDDWCRSEDMLAAFDDAAADGVDLISFSIGSTLPFPYFEDAAAIGAFHAMRRGVLTSAAAGNSALDGGRVDNVAPWILSVAASSTDRRLVGKLVLGNGKTIAVRSRTGLILGKSSRIV